VGASPSAIPWVLGEAEPASISQGTSATRSGSLNWTSTRTGRSSASTPGWS